MGTLSRALILSAATGVAGLGPASPAAAHEPLFGLGPHSIGKYAWALESELEGGDDGWANAYELAYGITPDVTVTAALPYLFGAEDRTAGIGDLAFRAKYRFLRRDVPGASDAFALHGGVKLPTGSRPERRSSGTRDYFAGLSFGHEGRSDYAFADVRYRINGSREGLDRGDVLSIDAAYGIRPWKLGYLQPDAVFLLEVLGQVTGRSSVGGVDDPSSGGKTIGIAPGILFSYRNVMLKAGVRIPLVVDLDGSQDRPGPEFIFAIDVHMPPFK
jgi:hypothetical protein